MKYIDSWHRCFATHRLIFNTSILYTDTKQIISTHFKQAKVFEEMHTLLSGDTDLKMNLQR